MTDFNSSFLDMVSHDMDFEQAYNMYSNMQQKQSMSSIEQLQMVQLLNQQYQTDDFQLKSDFDFHRSQILHPNVKIEQPEDVNAPEFDQFFSNTESDALEKFLENLTNPSGSSNPMTFYNNLDNNHHMDTSKKSLGFDTMFDFHTMKSFPEKSIQHNDSKDHEILKKELTEAFSYPMKPMHNDQFVSSSSSSPNFQLPTPCDSRQSSATTIMYDYKREQLNSPPAENKKRTLDMGNDDEDLSDDSNSFGAKKRRRSSNKHLLTVEQKRLNHSHSEQKRRQLCKLAYERCLRLIIDIDAFNKLPEETTNKKSKRARVNKDGLPNLSKHTALIRISAEIMTIQEKNEKLKKLIHDSLGTVV
jgi:hypothetical protein